jgi:hypothetical protein
MIERKHDDRGDAFGAIGVAHLAEHRRAADVLTDERLG